MNWQHRAAVSRYGARPMSEAPTDGTAITAYVQNTIRAVHVRWNGRFWDEGDGELWDTWQLVGWKPV